MRMKWVVLLAGLAMIGFERGALAGKFNKVLSIGDPAPPWPALDGVDDKTHPFEEYAAARVLVVLFTCNHCPVAQAYEERIKQWQDAWKSQRVAVVAISVSRFPADDLAHMKQRAKERQFNFPYLYDPTQEVGRRYGVTNTPTAFVLDADRKIIYMGTLDDSWEDPQDVQEPYLLLAVQAALQGKCPEVTETRPVGCTIEYSARLR